MKILALEPFYGGSHRAFLDGWVQRSSHEWTVLGLPDYKWKWRMRHAAITFAEDVSKRMQQGESWDVMFVSDMLNLAEFLGLAPLEIRSLPVVLYFHENQLTYPSQTNDERDFHYAFTNFTSALAADEVWFNSHFHKDSFLTTMRAFLSKMPDFQPLAELDSLEQKSSVQYVAVEPCSQSNQEPLANQRLLQPLHILWSARWEHDKNPDDFFATLSQLKKQGIGFRLSVIGESFRNSPDIFQTAREQFSNEIEDWGFQETREEYQNVLQKADVIVSTAIHEFFGISVIEAISAGVVPLLPQRLAYPEILELETSPENKCFFYDGSVESLVSKLIQLSELNQQEQQWQQPVQRAMDITKRFHWEQLIVTLDQRISQFTNHPGKLP